MMGFRFYLFIFYFLGIERFCKEEAMKLVGVRTERRM